jgi:hypothetical protein
MGAQYDTPMTSILHQYDNHFRALIHTPSRVETCGANPPGLPKPKGENT